MSHTKCYPMSQIGECQCRQGQLKLLSPGFEPQDRDSLGNPNKNSAKFTACSALVKDFSLDFSLRLGVWLRPTRQSCVTWQKSAKKWTDIF